MKRSALVHIHLDPRDPNAPNTLRLLAASWEKAWLQSKGQKR